MTSFNTANTRVDNWERLFKQAECINVNQWAEAVKCVFANIFIHYFTQCVYCSDSDSNADREGKQRTESSCMNICQPMCIVLNRWVFTFTHFNFQQQCHTHWKVQQIADKTFGHQVGHVFMEGLVDVSDDTRFQKFDLGNTLKKNEATACKLIPVGLSHTELVQVESHHLI